MDKFKELFAVVAVLEMDSKKFEEKPSKTSGARLRASLLTTKKLCDVLRKEVLTVVKAIPSKKSAPIDIPAAKPTSKSD
tara:strand:+ start:504 stop:740 length:237 start_codon:yes stop_codon:yes gene_type:complete